MDISYQRILLCILKWFGTLHAAFAALLLAIASGDLLFGSRMGYPLWSLPLAAAMIAIGLIVRLQANLASLDFHGTPLA
ncbi:MAG: hypothetical protein J2P50_16540 [Hyphomicrobiaceae bacterium]|nr:hypothetical protein [Hyphomicrobiaceae bacterium]